MADPCAAAACWKVACHTSWDCHAHHAEARVGRRRLLCHPAGVDALAGAEATGCAVAAVIASVSAEPNRCATATAISSGVAVEVSAGAAVAVGARSGACLIACATCASISPMRACCPAIVCASRSACCLAVVSADVAALTTAKQRRDLVGDGDAVDVPGIARRRIVDQRPPLEVLPRLAVRRAVFVAERQP